METDILSFMQEESLVVLNFITWNLFTHHYEGRIEDVDTYLDDLWYSLDNIQWWIFKNSDIDIVHETKTLAEEFLAKNFILYSFLKNIHNPFCSWELSSYQITQETDEWFEDYYIDLVYNEDRSEDSDGDYLSMNVYHSQDWDDYTDGWWAINIQDLLELKPEEEYKRHQMIMDKIDFIFSLTY